MSSNALVPFKLSNNFHDPLRCEERLIDINGKYIRIKQSWKSDGKGGTEIGFGASVYNCSIVLAHYLQENVHILKDKIVLELGCGTGFLSIALKILGAPFVICTDGDILSIRIAKENINRNFKDEIDLQTIKAQKLYWGNKSDEEHIFEMIKSFRKTSSDTNLTTKFLPIHKNTISTNTTIIDKTVCSITDHDDKDNIAIGLLPQYPDLIVGADIAALPYASAYDDLINTLRRNCSKETVVLLCYQCRHHSESNFFDLLKEYFSVEMLPRNVIHKDFYDTNINLYYCKLLNETSK